MSFNKIKEFENKVAEFEFDAGGNLVFFEYLREAYGFFLAGDDEHYENWKVNWKEGFKSKIKHSQRK